MRRRFVELAGEHPGGWDDIWPAFVEVIREVVEEPNILSDNVWAEIVPADSRYSERPRAVLSRKVGIRGGMTDNNLEASLAVTAFWTSVDVGSEIVTVSGRGPSSYEHDPELPVDEFVVQVERLPVVAVLRGADAAFDGLVAEYQPLEELD